MPAAVTPLALVVVVAAACRRRRAAAVVVGAPMSGCRGGRARPCRRAWSLPHAAARTTRARSPATAVARRPAARLLVMVVLPVVHVRIVDGTDRDQWAPICELCQRSTTRSSAETRSDGDGAEEGEHEDRAPQLQRQVERLRLLDGVAEAARDAGEELGEHGADEGEADGDARRREEVRQRVGHAEPEEHLAPGCVDRPQQLVRGGVDRAEAGDGVEQERHEAHERGADEDRLQPEAEPDHDAPARRR